MNEFWQKAKQQLAALNQREKVLILITGVVLFPGLIDFFLLQPLRDESTVLRAQTEAVNQRLNSFQTQQQELLVEIENDPSMALSRRIDGVKRELIRTKQAMLDYTNTLIAPQKMALMLESMLHERGKLKLIQLENLPVTPLFDRTENDTNKVEEEEVQQDDVFGLYRHGIRLQFEGNYMGSMQYLESLDNLPWKFYWENFTYEVQEYPLALITINIYTLSTSNWWIGDKDDE